MTDADQPALIEPGEALAWHRAKDSHGGPTLAGSPSWKAYLAFLQEGLERYGCVDVDRSAWTYERLAIGEWPDDAQWTLTVRGRRVALANYGANCGITGPDGVTAPLALWDEAVKPDVSGKLVVYRPAPRPAFRAIIVSSDYEALVPFESRPRGGPPAPQTLDGGSVAAAVFDELVATSQFVATAVAGGAAGILFATNLPPALANGLYTFPVPAHYAIPSAYLDRAHGDALIAEARAGSEATLRISGAHVETETFQLVAYLPGRDYGTSKDQQVHLRSHTDGPSISQDDGPLGLLAVVRALSRTPQRDRARTLLIELDCRHYMPGSEHAWAAQDYFAKHPRRRDKVVAMVAMEHLGNIEYRTDGDTLRATGRTNPTWLYATANDRMVAAAVQAARDNGLAGAIVRAPDRPGAHGRPQGPWFGMGMEGRHLGLPTFAAMADLGGYWQTAARIDRFDPEAFVRQVATFVQLTRLLMDSDLAPLQAPVVPRTAPFGI